MASRNKGIVLHVPDIQITLYKMISRDSAAGLTGTAPGANLSSAVANAIAPLTPQPVIGSTRLFTRNEGIDLTGFLGEVGGVSVMKSIRESAGGFSITFADKPYVSSRGVDSVYGIIEPQDLLEIRFRHNNPLGQTHQSDAQTVSPGAKPPILMRGFVSGIRRDQVVGSDGRPQRTVTVRGLDYGKILQMLQIKYLPGYIVGEDYLTQFRLFERFGVGFQTALKASDFVTQVVTAIVNPFLQNMMPPSSTKPKQFQVDASVQNGVVDVGGSQNQEGSVYDLLKYFGDVGIWNELYVESREDGEHLVYRPNPIKDLNGVPIQFGAANLVPVQIPARDIIGLSLERTDDAVANYFWCRSPRWEMVDDNTGRLWAMTQGNRSTVDLSTYPNSAVSLYGLRPMQVETAQGGDDVTSMTGGQDAATQSARSDSMVNWIVGRRAGLAAQNRDNVLFESGTARIRANENVRPGCFVELWQGDVSTVAYCPRVEFDYQFGVGMFQTLTLERADGFIQRMANGGQGTSTNRYYAEMTQR
ncbi:MAG: hypothetical protein EPN70_05920 [Paraburkholderia sp.]|uniref:hypothetical protein n=1 Tax=Paraburkholderia sp. TaxID=1926495 RepID=UPI00120755C1|nr:hypothetical protein [Paraburkholderia sp.]TAM06380.1 MAG: hypothetical protein EPN70_05920 [Paraburkholderia sp.]